MSFSPLSYVAGLATIPTAVLIVLGIFAAALTGMQVECAICGYDTGPMADTTRAEVWLRWRWHKLRTGHHGRFSR